MEETATFEGLTREDLNSIDEQIELAKEKARKPKELEQIYKEMEEVSITNCFSSTEIK